MPATRPPDIADADGRARTKSARAAAYWGIAFVVLLLVSAGMVTVPGGDDSTIDVRRFYDDNRTVIVVAQLIGLAAAAALVPFALAVQRQHWVRRSPWVLAAALAVATAAALTAVPPLALCMVADSAESELVSALATASDLVDVVLFVVIAVFAAILARAVDGPIMRVLSAVVALVCGLGGLLLLAGREELELVAPMAFITLVAALAIVSWRRGTADPS